MNIYLQLDERYVIQNVVSMQHNVVSPLYIPYHELDYTMVGKLWDGVKAVPSPYPADPIISKLAFRNLFTTDEKIALYDESKTDTLIRVFLDDINAAQEVDLSYPPLIQGIQYLVFKGVLTSGRAASILSNEVI